MPPWCYCGWEYYSKAKEKYTVDHPRKSFLLSMKHLTHTHGGTLVKKRVHYINSSHVNIPSSMAYRHTCSCGCRQAHNSPIDQQQQRAKIEEIGIFGRESSNNPVCELIGASKHCVQQQKKTLIQHFPVCVILSLNLWCSSCHPCHVSCVVIAYNLLLG